MPLRHQSPSILTPQKNRFEFERAKHYAPERPEEAFLLDCSIQVDFAVEVRPQSGAHSRGDTRASSSDTLVLCSPLELLRR
jgi:hypothetical protein